MLLSQAPIEAQDRLEAPFLRKNSLLRGESGWASAKPTMKALPIRKARDNLRSLLDTPCSPTLRRNYSPGQDALDLSAAEAELDMLLEGLELGQAFKDEINTDPELKRKLIEQMAEAQAQQENCPHGLYRQSGEPGDGNEEANLGMPMREIDEALDYARLSRSTFPLSAQSQFERTDLIRLVQTGYFGLHWATAFQPVRSASLGRLAGRMHTKVGRLTGVIEIKLC